MAGNFVNEKPDATGPASDNYAKAMIDALRSEDIVALRVLKTYFPGYAEQIDYFISLVEKRLLVMPSKYAMCRVSTRFAIAGIILGICSIIDLIIVVSREEYNYDVATSLFCSSLIAIGLAIVFGRCYKNQYLQARYLHKLLCISTGTDVVDGRQLDNEIMSVKLNLIDDFKRMLPR